jgi:hypothetical protein
MKKIVFIQTFLLVMLLEVTLSAQCGSFSKGKNLYQLQQSLEPQPMGISGEREKNMTGLQKTIASTPKTSSVIFIPRWSAETLPFFCRIEHQWSRKHRIPLKFRLGSVEYVDWLEGK